MTVSPACQVVPRVGHLSCTIYLAIMNAALRPLSGSRLSHASITPLRSGARSYHVLFASTGSTSHVGGDAPEIQDRFSFSLRSLCAMAASQTGHRQVTQPNFFKHSNTRILSVAPPIAVRLAAFLIANFLMFYAMNLYLASPLRVRVEVARLF